VKPQEPWVTAAFQLQQGETGSFQDDKAGGYYAVHVDGITPPALRPLAEVRPEIVADWTKEQQAVQTAKRAEALTEKARAGTSMTEIAASAGVKLDSTPAVTRDPTEKPDPATPPALRDALFKLDKVGDIVTVTTDNGQVIARLSEIRAADPRAAGNAKLQPIEQELDAAMRADSLAQYREGLRQNTKVKINPQAVETVAGQ
jgi:peptidyl-prolyl cis-trans isomerase D